MNEEAVYSHWTMIMINMSSILDIDLDYSNLIDNPVERPNALLDWGACPIAFVVEEHHNVLSQRRGEGDA